MASYQIHTAQAGTPIALVELIYDQKTPCFWAQDLHRDPEEFNDSITTNALMLEKFLPGYVFCRGQCLVSQFSEDGRWYRSQVIARDRTSINVIYVDYGNEEEIPATDYSERLRQPSHGIIKEEMFAMALFDKGVNSISIKKPDAIDILNDVLSKYVNLQWIFEPDNNYQGQYVGQIVTGRISCNTPNGRAHSLASILNNNGCFPEGGAIDFTDVSEPLINGQGLAMTKSSKKTHFALDLEDKTKFDIWITSCSDGLVWLQRVDQEQNLSDFHSKLQKVNGRPLQNVRPGDACLAQYDGQWYRAIVTRVIEEQVEVLYVDYGNIDTIPKATILEAAETDVPLFALPLELSIPVGIDPTTFLQEMECTILKADNADYPFSFSLEIKLKKNHPTLPLEIVSGQMYVQSLDSKNLPSTKFEDFCMNGKLDEESSLAQGSELKSPEKDPKRCIPGPSVETGKTYSSYFSTKEDGKSFYLTKFDDFDELNNLNLLIEKAEKKESTDPVYEGSYFLSSFIGAFYRCEVINIGVNEMIDVLYVDYGNTDNVPKSSLRHLSDELAIMPRLCFPINFSEEKVLTENQVNDLTALDEDVEILATIIEIQDKICVADIKINNKSIVEFLTPESSLPEPIAPKESLTTVPESIAETHPDNAEPFTAKMASLDVTEKNDVTFTYKSAKGSETKSNLANPDVKNNFKTYSPGWSGSFYYMKSEFVEGKCKVHGFMLEEEERLVVISDDLYGYVSRMCFDSSNKYEYSVGQSVITKLNLFPEVGDDDYVRGTLKHIKSSDEPYIVYLTDYGFDVEVPQIFPISAQFTGPQWDHAGVTIELNVQESQYEDFIVAVQTEEDDVRGAFTMILTISGILGKTCYSAYLDEHWESKFSFPKLAVKTNDAISVDPDSEEIEHENPQTEFAELNHDMADEIVTEDVEISMESSASASDLNSTFNQGENYDVIITKISNRLYNDGSGDNCKYFVSCLLTTKWDDMSAIIDDAMKSNTDHFKVFPRSGTPVVIRDKCYDKKDTGFRRAISMDALNEHRSIFKLVDSGKRVALKVSRVFPSPSILSNLEPCSQLLIFNSVEDVREGSRVTINITNRVEKNTGYFDAWHARIVSNVTSHGVQKIATDVMSYINSDQLDDLVPSQLNTIYQKFSSILSMVEKRQ